MKITNKTGLPQQIVNICNQDDGHAPKENIYHATELLKPTNMLMLERLNYNDLEMDTADALWLIFGKAVHSIMEAGTKANNQEAEKLITRQFDDNHLIVGRLDLYDKAHKNIVDWKTATVTKVIKNDFNEYKLQGLIYNWILNNQAKTLKFYMFLKDWSKAQFRLASLRGEYYPPYAIYTWQYTITKDDNEFIENYIKNKLKEIDEYLKTPPGACSKEERWESDTVYAVMKEGRKTALKLFNNKEEAEEMIKNTPGGYLEIREGVSRRCLDYCLVKNYCSFYKNKYNN